MKIKIDQLETLKKQCPQGFVREVELEGGQKRMVFYSPENTKATGYEYYCYDGELQWDEGIPGGAFGKCYEAYPIDSQGNCVQDDKRIIKKGILSKNEGKLLHDKVFPRQNKSVFFKEEESQGAYLLMNLVPGVQVHPQNAAELSFAQIVQLLFEMALSVHLIHTNTPSTGNFVRHNDLTPTNIHFDKVFKENRKPQLNVYPLDFGDADSADLAEIIEKKYLAADFLKLSLTFKGLWQIARGTDFILLPSRPLGKFLTEDYQIMLFLNQDTIYYSFDNIQIFPLNGLDKGTQSALKALFASLGTKARLLQDENIISAIIAIISKTPEEEKHAFKEKKLVEGKEGKLLKMCVDSFLQAMHTDGHLKHNTDGYLNTDEVLRFFTTLNLYCIAKENNLTESDIYLGKLVLMAIFQKECNGPYRKPVFENQISEEACLAIFNKLINENPADLQGELTRILEADCLKPSIEVLEKDPESPLSNEALVSVDEIQRSLDEADNAVSRLKTDIKRLESESWFAFWMVPTKPRIAMLNKIIDRIERDKGKKPLKEIIESVEKEASGYTKSQWFGTGQEVTVREIIESQRCVFSNDDKLTTTAQCLEAIKVCSKSR